MAAKSAIVAQKWVLRRTSFNSAILVLL